MSKRPVLNTPTIPSEDEPIVGRKRGLDLTRGGLFLLIIGQTFPIVLTFYRQVSIALLIEGLAIILPSVTGGTLMVLGRHSFGPRHSRYAMWGLALYIIGYLVFINAHTLFSEGLFLPSIGFFQSAYLEFYAVYIISFAGIMIATTGSLLYSYTLQAKTGKILLYLGWATTLGALWILQYPPSVLPISLRITIEILETVSPALFIGAYVIAGVRIDHAEKRDLSDLRELAT